MQTITDKPSGHVNPTDSLLESDDELFLNDAIVTRVYGKDGLFPPVQSDEEAEATRKKLCRQLQEINERSARCQALLQDALKLCAGASQ